MNAKRTMLSLLVACSLAILSVRTEDMPIEWPINQPIDQPDYQLPILLSTRANPSCGEAAIVWRNNNNTCPERAVCADVFLTTREREDGTQCEEKRIMHNCLCQGGSVCPFENPSHFLYASAQQRQYTCQNICRLPYCGNIRSMTPVAQTTVTEAMNFGRRTYVRMDCRCPRHHVPFDTHRAVQTSTARNSIRKTVEYVCSKAENEIVIPDPCEI